LAHILVKLRFYVLLDTKQVISETFFPVDLGIALKKLHLTTKANNTRTKV